MSRIAVRILKAILLIALLSAPAWGQVTNGSASPPLVGSDHIITPYPRPDLNVIPVQAYALSKADALRLAKARANVAALEDEVESRYAPYDHANSACSKMQAAALAVMCTGPVVSFTWSGDYLIVTRSILPGIAGRIDGSR